MRYKYTDQIILWRQTSPNVVYWFISLVFSESRVLVTNFDNTESRKRDSLSFSSLDSRGF